VNAVVLAAALTAGMLAASPGAARAVTSAPTPPNFQAAQVDPAVIAAETAASAKAKATGAAVTVDAETGNSLLVVANPDGSFTQTQNSTPVRTKKNGAWVPIDTALAVQADGTVRPAATVTGVAFSDGGSGAMATLSQGPDSLAFKFPAKLPTPILSGATATYSNVLPRIDLQLTADASGFSELLVVHDAAAAANPALRALTLPVSTSGVTLAESPDGGATAKDASGTSVFHSDTATMWDSADTDATSVKAINKASGALDAPSLTVGSHVARVQVTATASGETLTPDQSLLTASSTHYPVYIDPAWSGSPSQLHWARISSNGWNIYDSTSTANGDHPRAGIDNWPNGAGETARTYYQMNTGGISGTSGIGGATVTSGTFYLNNDWAASGSDTPVVMHATGQPVQNIWDSAHLNWSNKPGEGAWANTQNSHEADPACGPTQYGGDGATCQVVPGTLSFDITPEAVAAANGNWSNFTVDVRAPDEGNTTLGTNEWKQFASGGGASISITYFRAPYLSGTYATTPGTSDNGTFFANSGSITMNAPGGDTDGEKVRDGYEIWNWANGTNTTNVANSLFSSYTATGGAYTYTGTLPDGTYAWRGVTESQDGQEWSGWSPWQVFTVDTSTPNPPAVESPEYPQNQYGAAFGTAGTFTFTNDQTNNVKGYIFSLDADLGTTVYDPASPPPTWSGIGSPNTGQHYWLEADNGNGTGTEAINGYAAAKITPAASGPHRLYAKAVDQAGHTSGEFTDLFYAGTTTPTYVYGDQLVNGYTAAGGTTVPKATWSTSNGGNLSVQANCCGVHFSSPDTGGGQAWLSATGTSGAVAAGDTATMNFAIPAAGYWDLGANLTQAANYGQYTLTLDAGTPYSYQLTATAFDGYHTPNVTTTYQDFGVPRDTTGQPISLTAGLHTLTLKVTGKNSAASGYLAGIDVLRLAPTPANCTITDLTACRNNTAISSDGNTAAAGYGADGWGTTLSATDLTAAGWTSTGTSGTAITVNGAPMTLPAYADGKPDNMVAAGQTIDFSALTGANNDANALVLLAYSTNGPVANSVGTITYASGSCPTSMQSYKLDSVPDWIAGPASAAAITFAHLNNPQPAQATDKPSLFAISVPLVCPGAPVASVTLPVVSNGVSYRQPAVHILGIGLRPASYVAGTANAQNWTGTFAAQEDSHFGSFDTRTVRMPVHITINGTQLRLHLSNAIGAAPISFDHVTIAPQSAAGSPIPTTDPTVVTFNTSNTVTIPAGGEITSDPVNLTTTQQETLLVSLHLHTATSDAVGHGVAQSTGWYTAPGTDATLDKTGTPFTGTMNNVDWLTGIDITSTTNTTGALLLYGDHTINADTSTGDGARLSDQIAAQLAATNSGVVPYGILNEGRNNTATTNNLLPTVLNAADPPNATDPADRTILDQTNIRTVLVSTGTDDILAGADVTTVENRLVALVQQVRKYSVDTMGQNYNGMISVYVATIPPDARFTAAQETVREQVNKDILPPGSGPSGVFLKGNADGAIDFAAAISATHTDTDPTVGAEYLNGTNPNNAYYQALATQYLTSTNASTGTVGIQPNTARHH